MRMTIEEHYKGNLKWLPSHTILYTRAGSRSYGTALPDSDQDYRGICIPPKRYRNSFLDRFEQAVQNEPEDLTIYEIRKFFKLAADCNPNILELLWVDEEDVLHETLEGRILRLIRQDFMSQSVYYTYRGYAQSQLKKIATHRGWLLNAPEPVPTREEFGLPAKGSINHEYHQVALAAIRKKMDSWEVDFGEMDQASKISVLEQVETYLVDLAITEDRRFQAAGRLSGIDDNLLALLEQERKYAQLKKRWTQYQGWMKNRNEKRAKLEAKFGYDTKHAMHLVRLLTMCKEILGGKGVLVRRPDSKFLLDIRRGEFAHEELMELVGALQKECMEARETTRLPKKADRLSLDEWCQHLIYSHKPEE